MTARTSYRNSVRPFVCPAVCHDPVSIQAWVR